MPHPEVIQENSLEVSAISNSKNNSGGIPIRGNVVISGVRSGQLVSDDEALPISDKGSGLGTRRPSQ